MYILALIVCFLPDENDFIWDNIIFWFYHLVNIGKFTFLRLCTALECDFFIIIYIEFFFIKDNYYSVSSQWLFMWPKLNDIEIFKGDFW